VRTRVVGAGGQVVGQSPDVLRAQGVGSCVVVSLWDRQRRIGGLAHVPLPTRPGPEGPAEHYVDSALERLLERLLERGCERASIEVKAAGCATLLMTRDRCEHPPIAALNRSALERTLERLGLDLVGRDLGGHVARSIALDTGSGALRVESVRGATSVL